MKTDRNAFSHSLRPGIDKVYSQHLLRPGIEQLCQSGPRRILDIGGGNGRFVSDIKRRLDAEACFVADYSESSLAEARQRVDGVFNVDLNQPSALIEACEGQQPFDLIFCNDVLEHLYDPWQVMQQIHHILPLSGRVVASIPNTQHIRFIATVAFGRWKYKELGLFDRTHIRFFSRASAIRLMTCTGLTLVAVKPRIYSRPAFAMTARLSGGALNRFFALQYEIAAEKRSALVQDTGFCGSRVTGA